MRRPRRLQDRRKTTRQGRGSNTISTHGSVPASLGKLGPRQLLQCSAPEPDVDWPLSGGRRGRSRVQLGCHSVRPTPIDTAGVIAMTRWRPIQCWWISATMLVDFQPLRISNLLCNALSSEKSRVAVPNVQRSLSLDCFGGRDYRVPPASAVRRDRAEHAHGMPIARSGAG